MNWEAKGFDVNYTVLGYGIDDAYNLIFKKLMEQGAEWLIIIEDDVLIPLNFLMKMEGYMISKQAPLVSGLYYLKSYPPKPLVFRGKGNGSFTDWKMGQKVWVDAVPFGALLCHASVIRTMMERSDVYKGADGQELRRVVHTPQSVEYDPVQNCFTSLGGTQDMFFCERIIKEGILAEAGWKKHAKKQYPFLVDTSIFCKHIDMNTGIIYP